MPEWDCRKCGERLTAPEEQVGKLARCPACLTAMRVPGGQSEPPANAGSNPAQSDDDADAIYGLADESDAPRSRQQTAASQGVAASSPGSYPGSASAGGRAQLGAPPPPARPATSRLPPQIGSRLPVGSKRYGFGCAYCSSRLEATEAMAGQEGQCPTCGNNIVIPILDRYGRLIDPLTGNVIKQDPHPVHAYAAAGDRAPQILRKPDGTQAIRCPRCSLQSPITSNNCRSCGMPFTMEGTTLEAGGQSNGFCVASMVLGFIGIPAFYMLVPSLLAVIFGIIGFNHVSDSEASGRGLAIGGIVCGVIGLLLSLSYFA